MSATFDAASRSSLDSVPRNRPVVVVHRYADGQERVYRYTPVEGDGYDTEYEQDNARTPPMASRWSLGSSVVESVKTTTKSAGKDDSSKDKEKEKTGKKKRLASFMSRLSLAPTHPYQPVVMVPGRWEDVEFVAPSPSRSRNRSLPLSVRAEMMREKERQRERQKEKEKEKQKESLSDGVANSDGDSHQHPVGTGAGQLQMAMMTGDEREKEIKEQNQDQDLGYAPSSM
jgi:hypothetical protein